VRHEAHHHTDAVGPADELAVCPVMNVKVNKAEAVRKGLTRQTKNGSVYLCCDSCATTYDENPEKFTVGLPASGHSSAQHTQDHNVHDSHHDHDKHAGHDPAMFKQKFWLSFVLTIPVLLYSHTIQQLFNFSMPMFPGSEWLPAILGIVIFFYGGLVFLRSARSELQAKQPGMMTLISLAITVAFGYSLAVSLSFVEGMDFWWELATLVTIMLLGHWLEMASVSSAQGALKELAKLLPDEAERVKGKSTQLVPIQSLTVNDIVMVRPGGKIPIDGIVTKGESSVNESMLTGESKAVKKTIHSEVIGGTINGSGVLYIKVSRVGDETALAGIMKLVSDAQNTKSKTQIVADRAAFYLTFIALGAALLTALGWALLSDRSASFILERVVTVLVIACPHALGLAVPLVTAISTTLAAKNGLLIRERMALEAARNIDVVLFDKTGTLTKGEQGVIDIYSDGLTTKELLRLGASVEIESEHPIARAIVTSARQQRVKLSAVTAFSALAGRGAKASINGKTTYVGGPRLLQELKLTPTSKMMNVTQKADADGKTVIYVAAKNQIYGAIMLADVIRPESKQAVAQLQTAGKRVAILTGDSNGVAAWVAKELTITEYFSEVLPEHKADVVAKLQADGSKVIMVGDGVNDAPALTKADVGIAIGAGTDVAIESAGIVLASSDPRGISKIVTLSRATYRKMVQNLFWATGYNAVAIPLAAGVFAGYGFVLSPALGAVFMSLSTIIVAINAQLLRRIRL
jgi:Cu2+-exporting ATPase